MVLVVAALFSCSQESGPSERQPDSFVQLPSAGPAETSKVRPNVIWIVLDACRARNLSCYGYKRKTSPVIDSIAEQGVLFEQHFSQATATVHSVPSYLSGKIFPVLCLSSGHWKPLFRTPPPTEMLAPEIMRANGYQAVIVTSHPYFSPGCRAYNAFDEVHFIPFLATERHATFHDLNEAVFALMDRLKQQPFFLYLHAMDTHFPHKPIPGHDKWIDKQYAPSMNAEAPFTKRHTNYLAGLYDGSLHYADSAIKTLIDGLASKGLMNNTILVIGADHGECLGEDGKTVGHLASLPVDDLLHVPFIIAGPGLPRGRRVRPLSANTDILPTLVDLLNLETTAEMDGGSLLPLITGDADRLHDIVISAFASSDDETPPETLARTEQHVYTYDAALDKGQLYEAPLGLGRLEASKSDSPQVANALRQYLRSRILPKWEQYAALPRTTPRPVLMGVLPGMAEPLSAISSELRQADNLWTLWGHRAVSFAGREDCPPITFHFDLPDGQYRVFVELLVNKRPCGIKVKAESREVYEPLQVDSTEGARVFRDAGVFTVEDNSFDLTVDELDRDHDAALSMVFFVPIVDGEEVVSAEDQAHRNEQLEALGYL